MAEKVLAMLPHKGFILDIGCGQGPALEIFAEHGHSAHGIALNDDDVAECKTRGLNATKGDMHDLSAFDGQWFDLIWARHVLEHSPIPLYVLKQFGRIIPEGGLLYVEVPQPDGPCRHELDNQNHYSVFGMRAWVGLLKKAGFTLKEAGEIPLKTAAGPDKYFYFICINQ